MAGAKLRWGVGSSALSYLWLVHSALHSIFQARFHHNQPADDKDVAVFCLALVELLIVLMPLRRAERWAWFAALAPVLFAGLPRIATDPSCYAFNPHIHGCHQFMIALLVAIVGLSFLDRYLFF